MVSLLCLFYDLIYRHMTDFSLSQIINVSTIIFLTNLLLLVCGILYYVFRKSFPAGEVVYILLFGLLTVFCIWKAGSVERSNVHEQIVQFIGLLRGMIIIIGIAASFIVPFLYHSKGFEKHVI